MFNLEQSIAEWRKQMLAVGIKSPVPLEELENHLREEIERQVKSGMNRQQAFEMAAEAIGRKNELEKEFRKSEPWEARLMKLMGIGCSAVAFIFSLWFLSFLLIDEADWTTKTIGLMAVVTIVLGWKYNYKFLPVISNPLTRSVIGFACCLGSVIVIQLFIKYVLTDSMVHPARGEMPWGRVLAVFLWAWTVMAILASIGNGLEKAARTREAKS